MINDKQSSVRYKVLPDTWQVKLNEGGAKFTAEGKGQDKDGNTFQVVLRGEIFRGTTRGSIYTVKGTFSGATENYDLLFLALEKEITHQS